MGELVSEVWWGDFCTSWHFTNKYAQDDVIMFIRSDLIEKFNWPEMSPRELEFPPHNAETSTSNESDKFYKVWLKLTTSKFVYYSWTSGSLQSWRWHCGKISCLNLIKKNIAFIYIIK